METWWDRYPETLGQEKTALDAAGYRWEIDEAAFNQGRLVLHVDVPYADKLLKLSAAYPDTFPYFPPSVKYTGQLLSRHHHPLGKNLCLLAREGEDWTPGTDTLAGLLDEQLPKVLAVNDPEATSEYVAAHEDHIGEPVSSFLNYAPHSAIVVPDEMPPPLVESGKLHLKLHELPSHQPHDLSFPLIRGVIAHITDLQGNMLVHAATQPPGFTSSRDGYWLRLSSPPSNEEVSEFATYLFKRFEEKLPNVMKTINASKREQTFIVGFIWPDEQSWRTTSDDWVFLVIKVTQVRKKSRPARFDLGLIRADWGGENAWMQRAPALRPIRKRRVLLIGLGTLGSPVAINLAKAGLGHLDLIDHDYVQVGNTIRWALGWNCVGLSKVAALAGYLATNYPYTKVSGHECRIGASIAPDNDFSDYELIIEPYINT